MAKTKITPAEEPVKKKEFTITAEQLDKLSEISNDLNRAKNTLSDIGDEEDINERQLGYLAGKVFITIDRLEEMLDDIIDNVHGDGDQNEEDSEW